MYDNFMDIMYLDVLDVRRCGHCLHGRTSMRGYDYVFCFKMSRAFPVKSLGCMHFKPGPTGWGIDTFI